MTSLPTPIIGLIVAVFVLVWLVLRTRVHALIAMLAAACIAGLLGGMGIDKRSLSSPADSVRRWVALAW